MKKYTKAKGWFKHYTKTGASARIKTDIIYPGEPCEVLLKFKYPDEINWRYYVPSRKFRSEIEVVHYILKHLETSGTLFRVKKITSHLSHPEDPDES